MIRMVRLWKKLHSVKPVLVDWQSSYRRCRNCLISWPHRSHPSHPLVHLEERSSATMWALSMYSDHSPRFGGVQSSCSNKKRYIWRKRCGRIILIPPHSCFIIIRRMWILMQVLNSNNCANYILQNSLHCVYNNILVYLYICHLTFYVNTNCLTSNSRFIFVLSVIKHSYIHSDNCDNYILHNSLHPL